MSKKRQILVERLVQLDGFKFDLDPSFLVHMLELVVDKRWMRVLDRLWQTKAVDRNTITLWGMTPLSLAAKNGHSDVVATMLKHKAIRTGPRHGQTPLSLAQQSDQIADGGGAHS